MLWTSFQSASRLSQWLSKDPKLSKMRKILPHCTVIAELLHGTTSTPILSTATASICLPFAKEYSRSMLRMVGLVPGSSLVPILTISRKICTFKTKKMCRLWTSQVNLTSASPCRPSQVKGPQTNSYAICTRRMLPTSRSWRGRYKVPAPTKFVKGL